jgi:two-component system cell cycle response regulator
VLVADSSPDNLESAREILCPSGYEVITAGSVDGGLALARDPGCDVILSDVSLTGGSGYDFLRSVRSERDLRDLPFLLITPNPVEEQERSQAMGATGCLRRPIDPKGVLAEVAACLNRKGKA